MRRGIIALLLTLLSAACAAPDSGESSASAAAVDAAAVSSAGEGVGESPSWAIRRFSSQGQGAPIGRVSLTDPAGGPARPATVGTHGLRILLGKPDAAPQTGKTVRVIYSRQGAADTRALTAVESPDEPGVYLGTVELVAAGDWRLAILVVDGERGAAILKVSEH
ncbi:MAG: hypothetical protein ACE5HV_05535 [Acidobacteriota bacterium]